MNERSVLWKILGASVLVVLVAGCAELKEDIQQVAELIRKIRGLEPAPKPPSPPPTAEIPPAAAAGLTLNGNCVGKDESGYAENLRLVLAAGEVRTLEARIDIPKRGSCSYRLADFRQTRQTPFVELLARSNTSCAIRIWQQDDRVTVAPTECAERCTRGAFEYAWPVQLRAPGGTCY